MAVCVLLCVCCSLGRSEDDNKKLLQQIAKRVRSSLVDRLSSHSSSGQRLRQAKLTRERNESGLPTSPPIFFGSDDSSSSSSGRYAASPAANRPPPLEREDARRILLAAAARYRDEEGPRRGRDGGGRARDCAARWWRRRQFGPKPSPSYHADWRTGVIFCLGFG